MVMSCYYIKKHLQRQTLSWLDSLFYCFIHQFGMHSYHKAQPYLSLGGNILSSIVMSEPITPLDASSLLVFTAHRQGNLCSLGSLSFPSLMISYIISSPTASFEYLFLSYFKTIAREQSDWSNSLRWYSTCATTRWTRPSTSQTISIVVTF